MELTEEVKEAILAGAYGMTRDGRKVKYIGETTNEYYPLGFITVPEKLNHCHPFKNLNVIFITKDTWKGTVEKSDHNCDIVDFWVEPSSKVILELPKPFKPKFKETFFTITSNSAYRPLEVRQTYNADSSVDKELIEAGLCFKTKQDAQAWVDAFKKAFNE